MAVKTLTDADVRNAKAKTGDRLELWDALAPGLCLRVSPGRKIWLVRYRFDGKQRRYAFAEYPDVDLADARIEAATILRDFRKTGADPANEKKREKAEARAQTVKTFRGLAAAYMEACRAGHWQPRGRPQSARTLKDAQESLDRYVLPEIGDLKLDEVTRPEVRRFLRKLSDRGIVAQANKALAVIRQVLAWAIVEFEGKMVAVNVAAGQLRKAEQPRTRVLTDNELRLVWTALKDPGELRMPSSADGAEGEKIYLGRSMAISLQLLMILLQRRQEIAGTMRAEINLDQALWLIPAERMKARKPHLVPLPPMAVSLFREAVQLAEGLLPEPEEGKLQPNDYPLFPSPHGRSKPIRPASITQIMRRVVLALRMDRATVHDLRRTGASALTSERLGISPFIRSLIIAHTTDSGGGAAVTMRHYDANSYIGEKRRALDAWGRLLLTIVGGGPSAA
jgi:integrase